MPDDERQSLSRQIADLAAAQARTEAKVDMALVEIGRMTADEKDCRSAVHDRITSLKGVVDKMQGFLSVHHWLLLTAELVGIGALLYLGGGHKP